MDRKEELLAYQKELQTARYRPSDAVFFHYILGHGITLLELTTVDLANRFALNIETVECWKTGANAPVTVLRPVIYRWLGLLTSKALGEDMENKNGE